ncbi:hypothetical protein R75461_07751 [Paraburkholderia nemoris]|nr:MULTISPECIES: hypothetical protein [Paraburkholderia]MBK3786550.1 hypothetical protein [Paraburkholderia aspalathi]CAE6856740.1 hypothetical protein R75461_07751 [Paraburkholderia nemoris]
MDKPGSRAGLRRLPPISRIVLAYAFISTLILACLGVVAYKIRNFF